jgi:FkbM family methyltransferase
MGAFEKISRNLKDARDFGIGFPLRHVATLFGKPRQGVKIKGIGTFYLRPHTSDLDVFFQIFRKKEYDLSKFVQYPRLLAAYQNILKANQVPVIIDAGANIGGSAVWFARQFPEACILAIEPDAENAAICRLNTASYANIKVVEAAIGAEPGRVATVNPDQQNWSVQTRRSDEGGIPIRTIPDLTAAEGKAAKLFLVKIDIEGFENDLFSNHVGWVDEAAAIIVEPHDWLFPGKGSSRNFQRVMGERNFEMLISGENLVYLRAGIGVAARRTGAGDIDKRMNELSAELDVCAPLLEGKLVLLDYPVYGNVGDQLIWKGQKAFLARHNKKCIGQFSVFNTGRRAQGLLRECDTICMQGGGNFGDLWPPHHKFREQIIHAYPDKRIVIFPQTVHFESPFELEASCEILKQHPDLHIFLRDNHSLAILLERGVPNLKLCPDMAHALWGKITGPTARHSAPLYLLRRDKEKAYLPADIERQVSIDWEDLLKGATDTFYRLGRRMIEIDGGHKVDNRLPALPVWSAVSDLLIRHGTRLLAAYPTIVTNRLHAVMLATLLGRQVVAFDNSYGKISSYINCWLKDLSSINFVEDPDAEAATGDSTPTWEIAV